MASKRLVWMDSASAELSWLCGAGHVQKYLAESPLTSW
jgi:hypothetical protein